MHGIFVMIGKPMKEIQRLCSILQESNALQYTTIIVSKDTDTITAQYMSAYSGAALADYYKFHGMQSFIIYDDVSTHNTVSATVYRISSGMYTYGNWTAELLERAAQLDGKYGGGSHTALAIADKVDDVSENMFYFLPNLLSHVDQYFTLSEECQERNITPPIGLFPVAYGNPRFIKGFLRELTISFRRKLFEMVEYESAVKQHLELDMDLEPEIEKISADVTKLEIIFSQTYETSFPHLLLLLAFCNEGCVANIHLANILEVEHRLYEYFEEEQKELWLQLCALKDDEMGSQSLKNGLCLAFDQFLELNIGLCSPF